MTIKTLSFIHQLLIEEESKTRNAEKIAREALYAAEDEGRDTTELEQVLARMREARSRASDAKSEFENHEW